MESPKPDSNGWYSTRGTPSTETITALRGVGPIQRLLLEHGPLVTARVASSICTLHSVRRLRAWCFVTRAALSNLVRLEDLAVLEVLKIRAPGYIRNFDQAESLLRFAAESPLNEVDLISISKAPKLREVRATRAEITLPAVEALSAMPHLEALDIEGSAFDDEMANLVAQSRTIQRLDIGATRLTSLGLRRLVQMKQLRELDLWATNVDEENLAILREFPSLEYVSVGGYYTGEKLDPAAITELLPTLPSLKRVWIDGVALNPQQTAALRRRFESVRVDLPRFDTTDGTSEVEA